MDHIKHEKLRFTYNSDEKEHFLPVGVDGKRSEPGLRRLSKTRKWVIIVAGLLLIFGVLVLCSQCASLILPKPSLANTPLKMCVDHIKSCVILRT